MTAIEQSDRQSLGRRQLRAVVGYLVIFQLIGLLGLWNDRDFRDTTSSLLIGGIVFGASIALMFMVWQGKLWTRIILVTCLFYAVVNSILLMIEEPNIVLLVVNVLLPAVAGVVCLSPSVRAFLADQRLKYEGNGSR